PSRCRRRSRNRAVARPRHGPPSGQAWSTARRRRATARAAGWWECRAPGRARSWPVSRLLPAPPFGGRIEGSVPNATAQKPGRALVAVVVVETIGVAIGDGPAVLHHPATDVVATGVANRYEPTMAIARRSLPDFAIDLSAF